jgi:transposase-like protein
VPKRRSPRPVSPDERARVAELHGQGWSRNAIARDLDRSLSVVTKIARSQDLSFDREQTKAATAARQTDLKALRTATMERLLTIANEQLDRIGEEALVYAFGGKDNDYSEHKLDRPPPGDVRNLMTAAAIAIDKHVVLDRHDTDSGAAEAIGVLGKFMSGLTEAARQIDKEGDGSG